MKRLIIGLVALTSISAFAQSAKVICGNGSNDSDQKLSNAISTAEEVLNSKLGQLSKVVRVSAPTVSILNNEQYRNQNVAICVTVELK